MDNTRSMCLGRLSAGLLTLFLFGCATTNKEPPCQLPESKNVESAFSHAREDLSRPKCHYRFDAYFQRLLEIAEGDPDPGHARRFSDFLVWANAQDIVNKRTAKDYYNRYFSYKFVSLPDKYSNCGYTCRVRDEVAANMREELRDKDKGLLKVTGDRDKYARANDLYESIQLLIEATCTACERVR